MKFPLVEFEVPYKSRRKDLCNYIKETYPESGDNSLIVLFGNYQFDGQPFIQESSFYYVSGVQEPASVLIIDMKSTVTLYIPLYQTDRAIWEHEPITCDAATAQKLQVNTIEYLGSAVPGHHIDPFSDFAHYSHILERIRHTFENSGTIFTLYPPRAAHGYFQQKVLAQRFKDYLNIPDTQYCDISAQFAHLRRTKDPSEIAFIDQAVHATQLAHQAAAGMIAPNINEAQVAAAIAFSFTSCNATYAFPSIVASGKNTTILHYTSNNRDIQAGDLVLIDIGARVDYYCADITRVYPASGTFSERQKEIYSIVLETQEYIASIAGPGYWLSNENYPEKSLRHLARAFLDRKGYCNYFPHGISHFMGLDVHDVGSTSEALKPGDVITIEPGIYIPDEKIGIRIEDNYLILEQGTMCLSEDIPKSIIEIENMMQAGFSIHQEDDLQDDMYEEADGFDDFESDTYA